MLEVLHQEVMASIEDDDFEGGEEGEGSVGGVGETGDHAEA